MKYLFTVVLLCIAILMVGCASTLTDYPDGYNLAIKQGKFWDGKSLSRFQEIYPNAETVPFRIGSQSRYIVIPPSESFGWHIEFRVTRRGVLEFSRGKTRPITTVSEDKPLVKAKPVETIINKVKTDKNRFLSSAEEYGAYFNGRHIRELKYFAVVNYGYNLSITDNWNARYLRDPPSKLSAEAIAKMHYIDVFLPDATEHTKNVMIKFDVEDGILRYQKP